VSNLYDITQDLSLRVVFLDACNMNSRDTSKHLS